MDFERFLNILHQEVRPATGCTEPIAVAYAAARARRALGDIPLKIEVTASANIIKNAMGVHIPGTDEMGVQIAAAMGVTGGRDEQGLNVLDGITAEQVEEARRMVSEGKILLTMANTEEKLYIRVRCVGASDWSEVLSSGSHTGIVYVMRNDSIVWKAENCQDSEGSDQKGYHLTLEDILNFVIACPIDKLLFLEEGIQMNWTMAQRGLSEGAGLAVGKTLYNAYDLEHNAQDIYNYACALAAAAADARMAGLSLPVMSTAGSGNHGITATVPVTAMAERMGCSQEKLLRAIALSDLVTVLVKESIGKLSSMCGCGIGASIGACCGMLYLQDETIDEMYAAARNIVADVSGIVCDGAKEGCALKIATAVSSAGKCAMLAQHNRSVGRNNGIVATRFDETIRNLGVLVHQGMNNTDDVILNIMMRNS